LTAGGVLLWRSNQELLAKKNRLELKSRQTREVLDKVTGSAIDDMLSRQLRITAEHTKLLRNVLQDYEQFAAESEDDPEARLAVVHAHLRVGQLRAKLGQAGAEESLRRALDLSARLLEQDAQSPEYRLLMARCRQEVGSYIYLARPEEAWSSYYSAVMMLNKLNEEYPKTPAYQRELAKAQTFFGFLYKNSGQLGYALHMLTKACHLHEELARVDPNDDLRITWADGLVNLHDLLTDLNRLSEAQSAIRDALSLLKPLTDSPNADPRAVDCHSRALASVASVLWYKNQPSEAAEALEKAQILANRLVTSYPAVPEYRRLMAGNARVLGSRMSRMGRRQEARIMLRQAAHLYAQLVADCPDEAPFQVKVAEEQRELCEQFFAMGERDDAEESGQTAIKTYERMNTVWPDRPQLLNNIAWILTTCPIKSLRDPPRAVALARRATDKAPNMPTYWDTLGAALYRTGEWKQAKEALRRALELSRDGIPQSMLFLSMTACRLGDRRTAWDRHNQVASWLVLCQRENCEVQRIAAEERDVLVVTELQHLVAPITRRVARAANDIQQWAARTFPPPAPMASGKRD